MTRKRMLLLTVVFMQAFSYSFAQEFTPDVRRFIKTSAPVIALTDVKVMDGTGRPSSLHQTIVIANGRIAEMGAQERIKIPADAQVINCTGKTVIPGLVMLHEHLYYTMFLDRYFNIAEMSSTFSKLYLAAGASTIRTAGSIEPQTDLAIKRMIGEGKLLGPDMDVTAPYIERPGFDIPALNTVKDSAEAAASVVFWANKGCTSFKMYMHATTQDLQAVVREAHKRGLKVTGHLCTLTYREAAELGIDNLEHGFMASSDFDTAKKANEFDYPVAFKALQALDVNSPAMKRLIQLLVSKKVALTSTLPVFEPSTGRETILGGGEEALIPQVRETVTARWRNSQNKDSASLALFKKNMAWEKQFYEAGGLLVAGTDPTGSGRTIAGYGSRREIELLVEAGFTPLQAIKIATLNGAIYLGREQETGTVEKGKAADLVLIDGDPEADIKKIRHPAIVFKKGVGFDSQAIFESVKGKVGLN
ncbi:MAG: amidohydrolase family protein [Williamsia sp.]|nr:amidohydrolase family protein [Williamsia sp.]